MRDLFRYQGPEKANAFDFPIITDPGVGGASYTEGTGLSNTEIDSTDETATATAKGAMATITDELTEISLFDAYSVFGNVLVRSVLERFETDATSLLDEFANTSGVAGVPTTWAVLLEAANKLEQRDMVGQEVFVLDPVQVGDVRNDIGTSGAVIHGNRNDDPSSATLSGDSGIRVGNAPVYQTSLVSATGGGCFLKGVALGLYEIRPIRTELQRVAELPGTKVVVTQRYGSVEIRDVAGQTILI